MKRLSLALISLLNCVAFAQDVPVKLNFQAIPSPVVFRGDATTAERFKSAISLTRSYFRVLSLMPTLLRLGSDPP